MKTIKLFHNVLRQSTVGFLTICFTSLLLFMSCSKNDSDDASNPKNFQYRIKDIIYPNGGTSYTYNSQNQVLKTTILGSTGSYNYQYDSNGFLTLFEIKDYPAPSLSVNKKITYTNNSQGKVLESISENYNGTVRKKSVYNYVGTNLDNIQVTSFDFATQTWNPSSKINYTYNAAGLETSSLEYDFESFTQTWVIKTTINRTYNALNLKESVNTINSDGTEEELVYNYDATGKNNILKIYRKLNGNTPKKIFAETTYVYDIVKPVPYKYIDDKFNKFQWLNISSKYYDQNGNYSSTITTVKKYEYNEAGYVTKEFENGNLKGTYILEKIN
jgi:hypothetical protein